MKRVKLTIDFFIALWHIMPVWLKTIIVFLIIYVMGDNGIFDKP